MPEQKSGRGLQVTASPFEQPFETPEIPLGVKGLNLHTDTEALEVGEFSRLTNAMHDDAHALMSRWGLQPQFTGGTRHHSIRRLLDPQTGAVRYLLGVDNGVHLVSAPGAIGAAVSSGYSGDPLTLVPHRPPLSGDPWMFVADRSKMAKIRADGLALPIGLAAPTAAPASVLANEYRRSIAMCDASDGTEAANWVPQAGHDKTGIATDTPEAATAPAGAPLGDGIYCVTAPGSITTTYDSWWGCHANRDLTILDEVGGTGTVPASDDDIVHVWMKLSHPHLIEELRIYIVCSDEFDPGFLPGTPGGETSAPTANTDAYVKAFRGNDYVQFVQAQTSQVEAAEQARLYALRDQDAKDRGFNDIRDSWETRRAETDPERAPSFQLGLGAHQWFSYGDIGSALRRGDFQRIGSTPGRDWSTMTGVILYVRTRITTIDRAVGVAMDDLYITGGFGPDTVEPGLQQYDYRVTNYDPRTGAESNGSPEQTVKLDAIRRQIAITPAAAGDGAIRQRFYRRGGSLFDDWFYLGQNTTNGGAFLDGLSDDAISAAGTMPEDHFEAVPTIDDAGNTILAQPVPVLFGPHEGMLFALGDPHRPGHVYWCIPGEPDHWPPEASHEVCAPSEELMNGCLWGGQPHVFSRERLYVLYPGLTGQLTMTSLPSGCTRGLVSRWAMCVGPGGIFFVAKDGVFVTTGGGETKLSTDIESLFIGVARNGYQPIDFSASTAFRLECHFNELYFQYQDTTGAIQVMVFDLEDKNWRHYKFAVGTATLVSDATNPEPVMFIGGASSGKTYLHDGFSDDGVAIAALARTGSWHYGRPREDKLLGDQYLDVDRQGETITLQNFLNGETVTNPASTISEGAGRARAIFDVFGRAPQKARSLATELSWSSATTRPMLYRLGTSIIPQPDLTINRVTQWQDGGADEVYLSGVTFDCDTGGVMRTIVIEYDFAGSVNVAAVLQVTTNGRHKQKFSWPAVQAHLFRVRPDDECKAWILYRADWIAVEEPPRIAGWDIHFENAWDVYYTGLDLYCDTGGVTKTIEVYADGVLIVNPATGGTTFPVTANGRQVVHLTLTWGRAHVLRFRATDPNPGLLYDHRWHTEPEPSEQANWNQNFSDDGTLADKWFKAFAMEIDTKGQTKMVNIEVDGVVVETLPVTTDGRKVVQMSLAQQHLGRVLRVFPVDANPSRAYRIDPIFDVEPYSIRKWETQETPHGVKGYKTAIDAHVTLVSTADVTLTLRVQRSQNGDGALQTLTYTIPSTNGEKLTRHVPFDAHKGVLFKYVLESSGSFRLYREESYLTILPWGADQPIIDHPFGNDDLDATRGMTSAPLAAARSGGTAA